MGKWVKKKLGEVAKTFTGLTYSPNQVSENGILVLRSSNIKDEQLCLEDNVFVSMDIPERAIVHENDILICVRNGSRNLIGKSTFIPKEAEGMAFGAFMTILRSDLIEPRLLLYIWQSNSIQRQVANNIGATINQITNTDFKNFDISYPSSLSEQRRIASILSSADKVIDSTQKLIAKYKQIKQGMMEDLLKPKEGWKKVKLGECLRQKPDYGINAPAVEYDNNLPTYLRITDITEDGYYSRNDIVSVSSLDALNYKLEDGDLVFARTGASVGKTYLYNQKDGILVFAGFLIRVRTDEQIVLSQFFKYQTQTPNYKNWIAANSMRTGQPGINGNEYGEFTFYIPYQNDIPDLPEQCRIASILSGIDKKIESEEKVLEKYKKIKKGLMEKLLNE